MHIAACGNWTWRSRITGKRWHLIRVHEHLGEAYLAVGDLANAEAQLEALRQICLIPCDEYGDLERAIAIYRPAQAAIPASQELWR